MKFRKCIFCNKDRKVNRFGKLAVSQIICEDCKSEQYYQHERNLLLHVYLSVNKIFVLLNFIDNKSEIIDDLTHKTISEFNYIIDINPSNIESKFNNLIAFL